MIEPSTLWMFSCAILVLMMAPGPNMAFVIAHAVRYGWRGGMCAALGIGAADLVLTALTAAGVTALVLQWPPTINLIRLGGAAYLLHMAWKILASARGVAHETVAQKSLGGVWMRSLLNSLLNPKALLFFMVFLPQFVDASKGHLSRQLVVLGVTLTLISTVFHAVLGSAGGVICRLFAANAHTARWRSWCIAAVLAALALRLALELGAP